MGAVFGRGTSLSLSLSLSRCSHFLASLWAKFKGLFYSFYHNFILSCRKFFLFHRSFNSSFCLQKAFFRAFCLFEIFKRCVCALLRPFCHFEPFAKRRKIYKDKRKLTIFGYFANAQYDKFRQKPKFDSLPRFYFVKSCNDGYFRTPKAFFHSNFRDKIHNFTRFYGLPRSLCSLAMTARQKFKFFTQNSRLFTNSNHFINSRHFVNSKHCINSTHFINLSQILSLMQGFFISLPQVFAQCKLINFNTRRKNGR